MNSPKRSSILLSQLAVAGAVITASLGLHAALLTVARTYDVPIPAQKLSVGDRIGAIAIQLESATPMPGEPPRSDCPPSLRETELPELLRESTPRRPKGKPVAALPALPTAAASAPVPRSATDGAPESAQPIEGPALTAAGTETTWSVAAAGTPTGDVGGAGNNSSRSPGSANGVGAGSVGDAEWIAHYGSAVHAKIAAAVQFPERAARENRQGVVLLRIVLDADGRLQEASVIGGQADPVLRDAALAAVRRASPFPAPPRPTGAPAAPVSFRIPVRFYLRGR